MEVSQLIILIILVIVGIVLFVLLLVEIVNVPKPLVVPFADGTTIKIKSLANNLYLRPVPCSSFTCANPLVSTFCEVPGRTIVAAIGQVDDPLTNWQLCQYSALSDQGEAKYLIYSESNQNTFIMGLTSSGVLFYTAAAGICTELKTEEPNCTTVGANQFYFSFILNESTRSRTNTTSGSYNIIPSCFIQRGNGFLISSGIGAISLPSTTCPPLVLDQAVGGAPIGCPEPQGDPRCTLSYLFEVEVQS